MFAPICWNTTDENSFGVFNEYKLTLEKLDSLSKVRENHPMLSQEQSFYEDNYDEKNESIFNTFSPATPTTKSINETTEKLKKKDYAGAFFIASQLALDFPNIIDDTLDAIDFASKYINDKTCGHNYKYLYKKAYDWKQAQHPFSYFRGTLLQDFVNPNSKKCVNKKLANWVIKKDISLWQTKLGKYVEGIFELKTTKIKTNIKSLNSIPQRPINIKAYKFITSSKLGEITARAMTRTPVIGLAMSGFVEGCQVINEVKQGEATLSSIGKAIIRFVTSAITTAYLGAIGAKKAGPFGSMAGIAVAGLVNNTIANALD